MEKKIKESENYVIAARDIKNPMRESLNEEAKQRQAAFLTEAEKRNQEINAEFEELDAEVAAQAAEKETD